jgi:hypothetical protein
LKNMMKTTIHKQSAGTLPALAFVVGFRIMVLFYWLARFGGNWAEDDSARTTASIDAVFQTGALVPKDRYLYANGFLYQVFGAVMAQITGLSVVEIQRWLMPLLGIALTVVAFVFYLRIFGKPVLAAAATILLNLQGDFIYTTLRSSHEKVDFLLIFVSLLLLVLSVRWFDSWRERVALATIYYLVILAENTNNVFFASTFTITLILSFLFWYGLTRYTRRRLMGLSWVAGLTAFALLATFILVTFIYPTGAEITSATFFRVLVKWLVIFFAIFVTSMLAVFFIQGWRRQDMAAEMTGASWLLYVAIVSIVFVFIVIFVWYSPSRTVVTVTGDLAERIRLFMVSPVSEPAGLLEIVSTAWIFPNAWLWLRIYDIAILLIAAFGWIYMLMRLRSANPESVSPVSTDYFWLLVLLPAFTIQNILFVVSDLTGSVGDINNLQIRLIPFTALIAAPTAAYALLHFLRWLRTWTFVYRLISAGLVVAVALSMILGLVKGTSEPLLSNNWLFYAQAEQAGIRWLDQSMPQFNFELGRRVPLTWAGPDYRLGRLWREQFWGSSRNIIPLVSLIDTPYTYILISPGVRLLSERYSQPIPDLRGLGVIYDNGNAQIYYQPLESRR